MLENKLPAWAEKVNPEYLAERRERKYAIQIRPQQRSAGYAWRLLQGFSLKTTRLLAGHARLAPKLSVSRIN
jgi:hypothetical protein